MEVSRVIFDLFRLILKNVRSAILLRKLSWNNSDRKRWKTLFLKQSVFPFPSDQVSVQNLFQLGIMINHVTCEGFLPLVYSEIKAMLCLGKGT